MNVNKKFDRLKQWGKERIGGEVKTDKSEDFKALEVEMQLRHDGMERLKKSGDTYIKWIAKRDKYEDKEQQLPVGYFGLAMAAHADDFEPDAEFGQCLALLGRANERIARTQETFGANATSSWLESLERSLMQLKEYQAARKKLESRRLAYDAAAAKVQKSKKEDFRMEEELRSQKLKYEESNEDVYRRMMDIKEAEVDSVADLTSFLDAELAYHDRCREILLQVKREWPGSSAPLNRSGTSSPVNGTGAYRRATRSRAGSIADRVSRIVEDEAPSERAPRPGLGSRTVSGQSGGSGGGGVSPRRELPGFDFPLRRTSTNASFEGPTSLAARDPPIPALARIRTDPALIQDARSNLRTHTPPDSVFGDDRSDDYETTSTPSSATEARARSSILSTAAQDGSAVSSTNAARRPPPPPPPSRAKKPPPPPIKRSSLSTSAVPQM